MVVVRDIMQTDIVTVPSDMNARQLARKLADEDISGVPVTDGDGELAGVVSQTDLGGGERTYAWRSGNPHHHLVCVQCGTVTVLPHDFLAAFETSLRDSFQFHADLDHWAVYGHCQRCRDATPDVPDLAHTSGEPR